MRVMPSTTGYPLAGRAHELGVLRGGLERAGAGECTTIWVQGPAGIGKTRLLTETCRAADEREFTVARAQADELEQSRPFGLVAAALGCTASATAPGPAAIAAMIATHEVGERGVVTVSSDPGLQFRVVDAFGDLVEQLAASRPLLLALDDLQWADASSLLVLHAIERRSMGLPIVLIGAMRPIPTLGRLAQLVNADSDRAAVSHLMLPPLSAETVHDLAAAAVRAEPGPGLLDLLARATGNPLFVTELLSALLQEGAIEVRDGIADVAVLALPPSLPVTILRRLSHLPADTLDVLRTAAVLGARFAVADLSVLTGRRVAELSTTLDPAVLAGVLVDDGRWLRFAHDMVHDAVYGDSPQGVLTALHRDAGERLAESGAPTRVIADQFVRAGDPRGGDWLLRAARQMAPQFPETAVELFDAALALMEPGASDHDLAAVERADTLMRAGNIPGTIASCRAILARDHTDAAGAGALLRLGSALIVSGRPAEALSQLGRLTNHAGATQDQLILAASESATAHLWLGQLDDCEERAHHTLDHAAAAGNEPAVTGALAALSVVAGLRADFTRAIEVSSHALRGVQESRARSAYHYPLHASRGFLLLEMDRFDEAREVLLTGRRRSEDAGVLWPLATYQAYLGMERFGRGEWDDAVSELETGADLVDETGVSFAAASLHTVATLIRLHRNDLTGAATALATATAALPRGPRYVRHRVDQARALMAEADGDSGAAAALLAKAWDRCVTSQTALDVPLLAPDLVRLSLATGDAALAEEVTGIAETTTRDATIASRVAAARRCRGLLTDTPEIIERAAQGYAAAHRLLEASLAWHEAATSYAQHDNRAKSRVAFRAARSGYERLGAHRDLLRLAADLRAAGIPRGPRGPRRRPDSGWASLTDAERAVADLVADGLTNPQIGARLFISRRTVQTHVSHIFTKLELKSRAQLAAVVGARRDQAGSDHAVP